MPKCYGPDGKCGHATSTGSSARATSSEGLSGGEDPVLAKILQKFFDNAKDGYKKDADQRTPDYETLKNKAAVVSYDINLKRRDVEIDSDTDGNRMSSRARVKEAEGKDTADGRWKRQHAPCRDSAETSVLDHSPNTVFCFLHGLSDA